MKTFLLMLCKKYFKISHSMSKLNAFKTGGLACCVLYLCFMVGPFL